MATFNNKSFITHDDYMTPKSAWENIKEYIPQDKILWEAFYGNGSSGTFLQELGFDVIHKPVDFFENNLGEVVCTNPPFSKCPQVLKRLVELDKPFIMIMPSSKINTQYFRNLLKGKIQIIIPKKRIHFEKKVDGKTPDNWSNACNFDCFYYCYKMKLDRDIVWLE